MDQEVLDARAKLAARFGKTQVGGKGKSKVPFRRFAFFLFKNKPSSSV